MAELSSTGEIQSTHDQQPPTRPAAEDQETPITLSLENTTPTDHIDTEFEELQKEYLATLKTRDWDAIEKVTDKILLDSTLTNTEVREIFNSRLPGSKMTAVQTYVITNAPVRLLEKTIRDGYVDLSLVCNAQRKDQERIFNDCSALHLAFANCHFRKAALLIKYGHPLSVLNEDGDDPVHMMLKYGFLNRRNETRAAQVIQYYYTHGGFVGVRDAEGKLALTYAAKNEFWKVALAIAREHRKDIHTTNALPVRRSEVESSALFASLRMEEPEELISHLAELGRKAVDEELWPTPAEDLDWQRILLEYIPGQHDDQEIMSWDPLIRVLNELEKNVELFDDRTRLALLNARKRRRLPAAGIGEEEKVIQEALGLLDPDYASPPTFLHVLAQHDAPHQLMMKAARLGADPSATATITFRSTKGGEVIRDDQSVGHLLAAQGALRTLLSLKEQGYDINTPNSDGEIPLHLFLDYRQITNLDLRPLHEMLEAGADPDIADNSGKSALQRAENHSMKYLRPLLYKYSAQTNPPQRTSGVTYPVFIDGEPERITEEELITELNQLRTTSGTFGTIPARERQLLKDIGLYETIRGDLKPASTLGLFEAERLAYGGRYLRGFENPYHIYLFLRSIEENGTKDPSREHAFTKLLPHLLYNYPIESSHYLASTLEHTMDSNRRNQRAQTHPNAAELMALLNHPRDTKRNSDSIGSLTSALTSVTYFAGKRKVATTGIADLWGKIGTYGFNGILWRFDAESIHGIDNNGKQAVELPSILQRYGMRALAPNAFDRSPVFGPSFIVVPGSKLAKRITRNASAFPSSLLFDTDTFIEMHRGCFVVSHPKDGTLIIRNSSPIFGRDLLDEPAYFSPMGVSEHAEIFSMSLRDLIGITPESIMGSHNFESILSHELYEKKSGQKYTENPMDSLPRMRRLWTRLHTFRTDLSRWKFDTKRATAWHHNPETDETDLVGGHHSPGFRAVVEYLDRRHRDLQSDLMMYGESDKVLPDLAFIHPDFAPYSPYARMRITEESLGVLRKMANGMDLTQDEMEDSQIYDFFTIGFGQDADLVLLAPEKRR